MSNAFLRALPPLFSLFLYLSVYYIYIYYYCFLVVKSQNVRIIYIVFMNVFAIMFLWSFFATMCSSVGQVPDQYKFNRKEQNDVLRARTEDDRDNILERFCGERGLMCSLHMCTPTGSIRYCPTCMHIKPDRAHHCISCEVCILRMDHHCPWVNNCIGFQNYKNFLLLIFYLCLTCFYYIGTTIEYIIFSINNSDFWMSLSIGLGFGLAVVVGVLSLVFLCYHLYLVGINETTMENVHRPTFNEEDLTFDIGVCLNFVEVFGNIWCLWLLPVFSSPGSGCVFWVSIK